MRGYHCPTGLAFHSSDADQLLGEELAEEARRVYVGRGGVGQSDGGRDSLSQSALDSPLLRPQEALTHFPLWVSDFSHEGGLKAIPGVRMEEVPGERGGWEVTAVLHPRLRGSSL